MLPCPKYTFPERTASFSISWFTVSISLISVSDLCDLPSLCDFNISCKAGRYTDVKFLQCLLEKVFISPSLLKDKFIGYKILA